LITARALKFEFAMSACSIQFELPEVGTAFIIFSYTYIEKYKSNWYLSILAEFLKYWVK